ncbi:DUF7002 family protein [Mycolicibacterium stellerae]|uniref:DUF7002 family protein n=1 Tax=Mycolicibacterium stellerae TaxID=2358193 RepID=UPI0013DE5780|nr:hypothetical protein [Mycolicibacterium stellerae]
MQLPQVVYHLAEAANWPSIQRDGLLPATLLLQRFVRDDAKRAALQQRQRPRHVALADGVEIRDQRPLPEAALSGCLVDLTAAQWYAMLNERVFFWIDPARVNRQHRACGTRPQIVLTIDTARLIATYQAQVSVSPINTGNARRRPARRGAATFVPYTQWVDTGWASEAAALGTSPRRRSHAPVELTVTGAIPHADQYIVDMSPLHTGGHFSPT